MQAIDEVRDHLVGTSDHEKPEQILLEQLEQHLPNPLKMLAHMILDVAGKTRLRPAPLPMLAGNFLVQSYGDFLKVDQMAAEDPCPVSRNHTRTDRLEQLDHAHQAPDDRSKIEIGFIPDLSRHMIDAPKTSPATREEGHSLTELVAMIAEEGADLFDILVDCLGLCSIQSDLFPSSLQLLEQVLQSNRIVIVRDMLFIDS
jgi:hypothetical protein